MGGWVWRPFRGNTEPVAEEAPAPVQEEVPEVEPPAPAPLSSPVPDVSRTVQRAANVLSQRVWSTNAQPRDHLLRGINPPDADRYLAYAVVMGWVTVDEDDRVRRGDTNPVQPDPVAELPAGSSQGWTSWSMLR